MNVEYDQDVDAVDVSFSDDPSVFTHVIDDSRLVDYGANGRIVSLEFFSASRGIRLSGLPLQEYGVHVSELMQKLQEAGVPVVDFLAQSPQGPMIASMNAAFVLSPEPRISIALSGPPRVHVTDYAGFQAVS